jgi:hypothetical protein
MLCYFLAGAKNVACFFRRPLLRGMMESSPMRAEGMRLIYRNRKGVCLNDRAAKFD